MTVSCRDSIGGEQYDEYKVQTWSGFDLQEICSVRGAPIVKHYVEVVNQSLRLSPKKVWCKGILPGKQPVVRFVPERSNDTSTSWEDDYVVLLDQEKATFSRVLKAVDGELGTEEIDTLAVVEWMLTGTPKPFSLKFEVSTG